jgi:anaphase-promoting complex subunit 2
MQRRYQEEFHRFKPDKYLKFLPHLGTVDIKLELEDRTVEVESTPLQATIIEYFSKQRECSPIEIQSSLRLHSFCSQLAGISPTFSTNSTPSSRHS